MQFLITAIVVVNLLVGVVSSCFSVCSCTDYSYGLDVYCSNRGLDSIPTDLPNNTYNLLLDHNNITVIQDSTFNNLPNLIYIYLNSNKITSIQSGTFNDLPNLYNLELQNNDISVIEDNAFKNLPSLYYLELQYNAISVIENNSFNNLPNLRYLIMNNNPISLVSEHALENLPQLAPQFNFEMYCRGCGNIPFWRWLRRNQTFSGFATCIDYGGLLLYYLQPNTVTHCFGTSQSATSYTAVYTGVGSFVVTVLICVIIVLAILRYGQTKTNVHELERKGQNIRE